MEQILIGKDLPLASITKIDDIGTLQDGQLAVFDSNGQQVTGLTEFGRNSHFMFYLGQDEEAGSPRNGFQINPHDFTYEVTLYKQPIQLMKTITLSLPTAAEFDAATDKCCGEHPYRFKPVIVRIWVNQNRRVSAFVGNVPIVAQSQMGYTFNGPDVVNDIFRQLVKKLKGWTSTLNGNSITLTAPDNVSFSIEGDGLALQSAITTVTPMTYEVGGADLTSEQEVWDAVKSGYNERFEKSIMVGGKHWLEPWRTDPNVNYTTIVINTKTVYQYELLTNDNVGLWKKQFIVLPEGSAAIDEIKTLLDSIKG